jgi:hypothetical protein
MFFNFLKRWGWVGLFLLLGLVACGSANEVTLFIGPEIVGCEGQGVRHCLQTKTDSDEPEWTLYPNPILDFEYEQGFVYELRLERIEEVVVEEGMMPAEFRVIEVVSKMPAN